jgi:hypothetical protein
MNVIWIKWDDDIKYIDIGYIICLVNVAYMLSLKLRILLFSNIKLKYLQNINNINKFKASLSYSLQHDRPKHLFLVFRFFPK